jgi:hypothetical protein
MALLTHPEHNVDAIKKRLARILGIIDPDKARAAKAFKSNAKLDRDLFPRAMALN